MSNTFSINVRQKGGNVVQIDNDQLSLDQCIKAYKNKYLATASRVTTVGTVTLLDHGFVVGDSVVLVGTAPFDGTYTITSVTNNSFNFTVANSGALTDSPYVIRTELHVNEFRGMNAYHQKYLITQTIAQLLASIPAGSAIQTTVISGISSAEVLNNQNSYVAPADGLTAVFFTAKMVMINKVVYTTLTLTDMDRASTTVTVTCVDHGLKVGNYITVDSSNNALDGTYAVATVADKDTFTYTTTTSGTVTNATGTAYKQNTNIVMNEEGAMNYDYIVNELYSTLSVSTQEIFPYPFITAPQALSGAGAITLTEYLTNWTTTGANAGTLADATFKGQLKKVYMAVDGGDGTLTPTSLTTYTTITFTTVDSWVILQWTGASWVVIENRGATLA